MAVSIHTPSGYINPNQTEGAVWYILLYNFLITHLSFMKFGDFLNLSAIHILKFFFKIPTGFCSVSTFHGQVLLFLCVFCWKNGSILHNISRISVQKV